MTKKVKIFFLSCSELGLRAESAIIFQPKSKYNIYQKDSIRNLADVILFLKQINEL